MSRYFPHTFNVAYSEFDTLFLLFSCPEYSTYALLHATTVASWKKALRGLPDRSISEQDHGHVHVTVKAECFFLMVSKQKSIIFLCKPLNPLLHDPQCHIHPSVNTVVNTAISYLVQTDNQATLPELLTFPKKDRRVSIPQEIGVNYQKFGILLLKDNDGRKIDAIIEGKETVEEINLEILKRWLQGDGLQPGTWRTLIQVLQDSNLNTLAEHIEDIISPDVFVIGYRD